MTPFLLSHLLDRRDGFDATAPAVRAGGEELAYGELVDQAACLAGALIGRGIRPGDRVGVHLRKSVRSMVAVHGVLRAGAVVVALDPLAPPAALAAVVSDAGLSALVSDAREAAVIEMGAPPALDWAEVEAASPADVVPVLGDDPAYIIYTSGSTGRPKGIVHSHRSGLRYAQLAADHYGLCAADRLCNIAPLHFDQSTFELYAGPSVGACTIFVPEPLLRFPANLSMLVETERPTVWYSVPSVLVGLVQRGVLEQRDLSSLRWILFGGEVFPPAALRELARATPGARFSNVYGPAEVNQCTAFDLDAAEILGLDPEVPLPIGRAWADTELAVVDDHGRDVVPGQPGELLVRTATVMSGYAGRPDLTDAAFRARTAPDGREQRYYATGDLVVERPDGELVFLGRRDHQVKVRGHRIELEGVDLALADQPGVREATVVVQPADDGLDGLIGLVVAHDPPSLDVSAIITGLRSRLPAASVPHDLRVVEHLPRTSSGKIDRRAAAQLLYATTGSR